MLRDFLSGRVRLSITFWLFGILALVIFRIITKLIEMKYVSLIMVPGAIYFVYFILILPFIYFPPVFVAIWRSATNYEGNRLWPLIAKICVGIGALLLALNLFAIIYTIFNKSVSPEQVQDEVSLINRSLPVMIDKETEFTKASATSDTLIYHYKLINRDITDFDSQKFKDFMQEQLRPLVCASPKIEKIFEAGYSIDFQYVDKNDKPVTDLKYQQSDCAKSS